MSTPVLYECKGPLAFLTLNRPGKLNAIDAAMAVELMAAMDRAEADPQVRVIVLQGAGRAFSAGFDLLDEAGSSAGDEAGVRAEIQRDYDLIMRLWDSPKPTITAVHGYCLGGAFELALASDLTIASDDCRLGAPELRFGSGIVALLLPWVCGPKAAREILLTAHDRLDARRALELGIVNRLAAPDELEQETIRLALSVARNDRLAVALTRRAINAGYDAAGLRAALHKGFEACVEIENTETEESRRFYQIAKTQGAGAAAQWLDAQMDTAALTGKT
jgi:enoyl-CoA hydratase